MDPPAPPHGVGHNGGVGGGGGGGVGIWGGGGGGGGPPPFGSNVLGRGGGQRQSVGQSGEDVLDLSHRTPPHFGGGAVGLGGQQA